MDAQTAALEEQMAALQGQLSAENAKVDALRRKVRDKAGAGSTASAAVSVGGAGAGDSDWAVLERMLPELRQRIVDVYQRCGFKATASSDTISMLTQLEGKLEALLASLSTMDPDFVRSSEKEKENERRARVRKAKLEAAEESHELRQRKMLARAQAPVVKREGGWSLVQVHWPAWTVLDRVLCAPPPPGKPAMFRSQPFAKKAVVVKPDPDAEREKADAVFFM